MTNSVTKRFIGFAFFALLVLTLSISTLLAPRASAKDVEAILGVSLEGGDIENFVDLGESDFIFKIIDRHTISVEPANPNKQFYVSAGKSFNLSDAFSSSGIALLRDDNGDDDFRFENTELGMRIDFFANDGDLKDAAKKVPGGAGTVDLNDVQSFEFTWAMRYSDGRVDDRYFVLDREGWETRSNAVGVNEWSTTGVIVSTIVDKDNFNISIRANVSSEAGNLLTTGEGANSITYALCESPSSPVTFSSSCASSASGKTIVFPAGVTLEDIQTSSTSFTTKYDGSVDLEVTGGANEASEDSLFVGSTSGGIETGPSCETEGGEFSFIVCPALRFMNGAFTTLDDWIVRSLDFEDGYLADPDGTNQGVKRAWQNIRNIAYIVLVPIMLVMVIGTAIGSNAVDAYTVRRALPRLLAAIIFMSLSFDIARLLVQVSDEVGRGVAGLISQPFGGLENLELTDIFNPRDQNGNGFEGTGIGSTEDALALTGVAALIVAGQAGYITIGVLLSFLFVGVATLLIIFMLLTIRELLIVFLIVISPLAILTWIFRGNDGSWKLWWGTFWKLLMIFPIVMALLVTGRAFASIVDIARDNGDGDLFTTLVKLVAFIGPYFGILAAFKFLGGAFANLTGMVNDRSRGIFDRNRQFRQNSRKKAIEKAHSGQRWSGGNDENFRGRLNKNAMNLAHLKHANDAGILNARDSINRSKAVTKLEKLNKMEEDLGLVAAAGNDAVSGVAASVLNGDKVDLANQIGKNQLATHMKQWEADGYDGLAEDDLEGRAAAKAAEKERFLTANAATFESKADEIVNLRSSGKLQKALETAYDTDATDLVQHYGKDGTNQAIAQVMAGQRKYGDKSLSRFMVLKAMAGGTYYDGPQDTWRAAGLASKGDADAAATMVVKGRQALMGAGRAGEGAGGFGSTLGIMQNAAKIDGGNLQAATAELKELGVKHINHVYEQNPAALLSQYNQKENYIEDNLVPVMKERLQKAYDTYGAESDEYIKEVSIIENIHQSLKGTKPAIANLVGDQVMAYDVKQGRALTDQEERAATESYNVAVKEYGKQLQEYQDAVDAGKDRLILPNGDVKIVLQPPERPERTLNTARSETFRLQSDSRYQNFNRQWQDASAQQAQQEAAFIGTSQAIEATQNALNENPGQFRSGPPTF